MYFIVAFRYRPQWRMIDVLQRKRTFGYFNDLETAKKAVEENWGDINEGGWYKQVLIEKVDEGIHAFSDEIAWYQWVDEVEQYIPCEKPEWTKQICNLSGVG